MQDKQPEINAEYIIHDLTQQIGKMSRERAMYYALATQNQQRINELEKENKELKDNSK